MQIGYCTNIHAGTRLDQIKTNLEKVAVPVRQKFQEQQNLNVGLWLAAEVASQLDSRSVQEFSEFLQQRNLKPFTYNAFPFGDFHQAVVKHDVYLPTWAEQSRYDYTLQIAKIADQLAESGERVSISTLPIGWPSGNADSDRQTMKQAATNLRLLARELESIEANSETQIQVCLEPEPGCLLQTSEDVRRFVTQFLLDSLSPDEAKCVRRYLGVCHDICHSAVMFESQQSAIKKYRDLGIQIAKVQVSSAIAGIVTDGNREAIRSDLGLFAEPRYLHQTKVRSEQGIRFLEDLPAALEILFADTAPESLEFRSHFHVPVYLQEIGALTTTQNDIHELLKSLNDQELSEQHFEIETYAWSVSPHSIQKVTIEESISRELVWFAEAVSQL